MSLKRVIKLDEVVTLPTITSVYQSGEKGTQKEERGGLGHYDVYRTQKNSSFQGFL